MIKGFNHFKAHVLKSMNKILISFVPNSVEL